MTREGDAAGTQIRRGETLEVEIERLVAGGDGLARVDGRVVFVPDTAPGDRVRVRIEHVAKSHVRARLVEVLLASPLRRTPRCRHASECGGCQWQHVTAAGQREAKAEIVRSALEKIGGIHWTTPIEVLFSNEFEYRSRAEVRMARDADGTRHVGYMRSASNELCAVEECPVLLPSLQAELAVLELQKEDLPKRATRAHLAAGDAETVRSLANFEDQPLGPEEARARVTQHIHGLDFEFGARSFFQGNRLLIETLVDAAIGEERGRSALDLYCGAGLFTLPLARRFAIVLAVEEDSGAVELGSMNQRRNEIINASFVCSDVAQWFDRVPLEFAPDLVLLDPPRRGAGERVVEGVLALAPKTIRYVACDPATQARDLRGFVAGGYELESIVALDLYPQTAHIETVAVLRRNSAR
jgi:23S rRNA (uracil1939-C5)-methyltransferase